MVRKITALKPQKDRRRLNVYLDGEFAFGLSRVVGGWLQVGQELSEEKIVQLLADNEQDVAYQQALNYLSYRLRSAAEVRERLRKSQMADETIQAVMDRLERAGLVDDRRFAEAWLANRSDFRPRGRRLLEAELRRKKIASSIIHETLSSLDEDELAYKAGLQKARQLNGLEWPQFYKKMSAYLNRRGFNYETISAAAKQIWDERKAPGLSGQD